MAYASHSHAHHAMAASTLLIQRVTQDLSSSLYHTADVTQRHKQVLAALVKFRSRLTPAPMQPSSVHAHSRKRTTSSIRLLHRSTHHLLPRPRPTMTQVRLLECLLTWRMPMIDGASRHTSDPGRLRLFQAVISLAALYGLSPGVKRGTCKTCNGRQQEQDRCWSIQARTFIFLIVLAPFAFSKRLQPTMGRNVRR